MSDFIQGVRKELPIAVTAIPFGLILGASLKGWHIDATQGLSTSVIIFAGSSQFLTLQMLSAQAPAFAILIAALATNLRHILYSIHLTPFFSQLSMPQKITAAYLLTDECFAAVNVFRKEKTLTYAKYLGAGLTLWTLWNISTLCGYWLGNVLPKTWHLEKTIDFLFLAILTSLTTNKKILKAVAFAAFASVFTSFLPFKLNILIGIAVGFVADSLLDRRPR